ncbi:type VII secretion integral membrane protein EccD [Nocardioides cremeus]|jgi:type VII secretion integral membrane protein EccD|uniref:Type VII secretion integral membrane protein EccD n=1 Tax=Nocardioides cremeus TaxID=3058044 RepID=A0ABT8TN90_9ACTN|nr:type VII secretion integral membrane protein EccD [Nocardioides cremeus]MDO3395291.1 type VII secretion integral membrane protein EccD [Nocardioides cremeus]
MSPQTSPAPASATALVRVTVASGSRRVDLVLPGAVPLAELVPELARSVGLLDPMTVHGGYRVLTAEGRLLGTDAGLVGQGVEDGALLTVTAGVDDPAPRVYDDVVEAMTDVVERDLRPWSPASGRRTALGAAGLLMALGAAALLVQGDTLLAGSAAVVVATVLVAGAVVLSRTQAEPEAAVAVAWASTAYAAVAGLLLALDPGYSGLSGLLGGPGGPGVLAGAPVAAAGLGAVLAGLVALLGLGEGRALVLPPVVVGAAFGVVGLVLQVAAGADVGVLLSTVLVLVVLMGSLFPWLALGMTGARVEQVYSTADITADPDEIDPEQVGREARLAHEILLAITATVGLLLVLVAPVAVALGLAGTLLALVCCGVVMLRTRQYRTGSEVLVGLVSGIAGLASIAVALLWLQPQWRPTTALVLAVAGAVLLAVTLLPGETSVRRGRLGDVAESVCLLALVPLALVATGVFSAIAG